MTQKHEIFHGDCLEVLRGLPDNSVDSVCTDPPYGLSREPDITEVLTKWLAGEPYDHGHGGFMGKAWDSFVPHPDIWREVYRVLKPGGHALVFAGTRTQDLMTISLRIAGFEVRDVIEWLYFNGFPKSMDVSKAFDKRNGRNYPDDDFRAYLKERAKSAGLTGAEVDRALGTNGMWGHYTGRSQPAYPTVATWERLKPLLKLDGRYDEIIFRAEAEREKIAEETKARSTNGNSALPTIGGETVYKTWDITAPATELARKWDGWGTALKPAHEPIIVVRKPLVGTVADNVERYGTGAINIDASRIATEDNLNGGRHSENAKGADGNAYGKGLNKPSAEPYKQPEGRFPANCVTVEPDVFYTPYFNVSPPDLSKKASKGDRNSDWRGEEIALEAKPARTYGEFEGVPDNPQQTSNKRTSRANHHPTVKPTDLMAWLVRLVTPPGGTVLDPFAGSGSTLVAARREGFGFIGIEREADYVEIIKVRTEVAA